MSNIELTLIEIVGCASHSDTRRQQPQQPDALAKYGEHWKDLFLGDVISELRWEADRGNPSLRRAIEILNAHRSKEVATARQQPQLGETEHEQYERICREVKAEQQPDALDQLFRDCFGLLATVEQTNQDEWMDYFETKKCEFEERYAAIKQEREQHGTH